MVPSYGGPRPTIDPTTHRPSVDSTFSHLLADRRACSRSWVARRLSATLWACDATQRGFFECPTEGTSRTYPRATNGLAHLDVHQELGDHLQSLCMLLEDGLM